MNYIPKLNRYQIALAQALYLDVDGLEQLPTGERRSGRSTKTLFAALCWMIENEGEISIVAANAKHADYLRSCLLLWLRYLGLNCMKHRVRAVSFLVFQRRGPMGREIFFDHSASGV